MVDASNTVVPYANGIAISCNHASSFFDQKPKIAFLAGLVTMAVAMWIKNMLAPRWGETRREQLGRWALQIPFLNKMYQAEVQKQYDKSKAKVEERWAKFGPMITKIPEKGMSETEIRAILHKCEDEVLQKVKDTHFSGTIYGKTLPKVQVEAPKSKETI